MLAFSLCAGAVAYFSLPVEPGLALCAAGVAVGFLVWLACRSAWWLSWLSAPALMALGIAIGIGAGAVRSATVASPVILSQTGPVIVEGWVRDIEPGAKGARLRLDVQAIAGLDAAQTPRVIRLTHRTHLEVSSGRFVRCYAVLRPPPSPSMPGDYDFRRQAWFEQLGAVGYVQGRCRGGSLGAPRDRMSALSLEVAAFRRRLAEHVRKASGERAGGFAAALVSGDRSFMSQDDQEALRASGLSHLLAISGLHMSIVGGLVYLLVWRGLALVEPLALRVAVQKPAAIAALTASLAYLVISGASVSTQRAFIMSAVVFGAVLADRAALSLRSYAIAMMLVVVLQPESVMTPGFQMSFAATGALIAVYEAWSRHRASRERVMGPLRYAWVSLMLTSLVAGLATAPFALFHFNRVAALGFIANLLAMPIITFVSAPLAAFTLLATPFGQGDLGLRLFGFSLEGVLAVAHTFSSGDGAGWIGAKPMPELTLALISIALAAAMLARGIGRVLLAGAILVPAALVWEEAPQPILHWAPSGDLFVQSGETGWTRYPVTDGDGLSPLQFSGLPETPLCAGTVCTITTRAGPFILNRVGPDPVISVPDSDGTAIQWADVAADGGYTLLSDRAGTLHPVRPPPCGSRPWRACP
ncbi:MAG: ComEC/Rec2 family competence protein [Hyphomonas sp.]|nr:ComEC/Rec2 family competence protein [Hyphomonas sp.]